jgi:hypothetical protein
MRESSTTSLYDCFSDVPDFRRAQGRRFPLPALLTMITMALMSGHYGYREIARFLKANQEEIASRLRLKHVPSHVTVRAALIGLDFEQLNERFRSWAAHHLKVEPGDWIAIDGKAIRSTVTDYDSPRQDFVSMVSAFAQQQGVVVAAAPYRNHDRSETEVARELVATLAASLGITGAVVTMDALHCKRAPSPVSSRAGTTTSSR